MTKKGKKAHEWIERTQMSQKCASDDKTTRRPDVQTSAEEECSAGEGDLPTGEKL